MSPIDNEGGTPNGPGNNAPVPDSENSTTVEEPTPAPATSNDVDNDGGVEATDVEDGEGK
jgi:hypothetical protein